MNTSFRLLARAAACFALALPAGAQAQVAPSDIDIYAGISATQDRPNVLIVLDSSANWSAGIPGAANCYYRNNGVPTASGPTGDQGTKVGIEKCALYNMVDAVPVANMGGPDNDAPKGLTLRCSMPDFGGQARIQDGCQCVFRIHLDTK